MINYDLPLCLTTQKYNSKQFQYKKNTVQNDGFIGLVENKQHLLIPKILLLLFCDFKLSYVARINHDTSVNILVEKH